MENIKFLDLNFVAYKIPLVKVVDRYKASFQYLSHLSKCLQVESIIHGEVDNVEISGVKYVSMQGLNKFFYIPFSTLMYIRKSAPDIVLVQGLNYPLQVIFLKRFLKKECLLLVQHHGERPYKNPIKLFFQSFADRYVNGYLFTAKANANVWVEKNIIKNIGKCYEVLEASTDFTAQDKILSKEKTGISGTDNFVWVGRLDSNKDPITVLHAFHAYLQYNSLARLYMIYQAESLLAEIKVLLATNYTLQQAVSLIGEVPHAELPYWYSAADYYISGSHKEGSGYALIECMFCGCIPIVTQIPSFETITNNGSLGHLYPPGNADSLLEVLKRLKSTERVVMSQEIISYSKVHLSYKRIAEDIYNVCKSLTPKR